MSVARRACPTGSGQFSELAARVTTPSGERDELEIENPAVGRPLGAVPRCGAEDVELAVTRARGAQERSARDSSRRCARTSTTRARRELGCYAGVGHADNVYGPAS